MKIYKKYWKRARELEIIITLRKRRIGLYLHPPVFPVSISMWKISEEGVN